MPTDTGAARADRRYSRTLRRLPSGRPAFKTIRRQPAEQATCTAGTFDAGLAPVPSHTDALMRSTLAACAAVDASGIRTMLEVVPPGCRQGGFQLLGPFVVGPGEPPHLIGSQAKLTQYLPEGWPL